MRIGQLSAIFAGVLTIGAAARAVSNAPSAGENWPNWRGPDGNGVAQGNPPVEFGPARNLKWKTSIPSRGMATPIIWEDKIFIATAIPVDDPPSIEAEESAMDPAPRQTRGQRGRRGRGGQRAGGQVYMTSEQGEVLVARRGPKFEMLSSVDLGEMLIASPAVAGDELFIRGMNTLFCFAEPGR